MKPTHGQKNQQSMHSPVYNAASMGSLSPTQPLPSPTELTSMYTRQFAASKAPASGIYHAAVAASTNTDGQLYSHGLTVLQCARSHGPVDPHVYRDWLIFEERLKQSYRRLQRKKRSYLAQILAFGILVLYFAWFGFFGTPSYRFTCKLLSAGSAYCTYLIITNRRFLQSVKYPAQCNRALHQFRLRFETTPLQVSNPFVAASTTVSGTLAKPDTATRLPANANVTPTRNTSSNANAADATSPATPGTIENASSDILVESQLSFFPTVPRQLRNGYIEFKATYYRKRDAARRRMQERMRRSKKRRESVSSSNYRTSERRTRQHRSPYNVDSDHSNIDAGSPSATYGQVAAPLHLGGADSATDDSSASSIPPHKLINHRTTERIRSRLIHTLPEQDSSSESEPQSGLTPPSP
ncbi:hypothetical protein IWW36_002431 [Coemansia brasiliensis]|uniref:Transmembrane protein 188 n=1 Tax=Coemansia brasiliensis TaxID=2650707 RepID=A0A9W8IDG5_9FUNG|nr:hypothetical protein IWW36_002431 [Coemansia brasiliensis]